MEKKRNRDEITGHHGLIVTFSPLPSRKKCDINERQALRLHFHGQAVGAQTSLLQLSSPTHMVNLLRLSTDDSPVVQAVLLHNCPTDAADDAAQRVGLIITGVDTTPNKVRTTC